ncbi:MAG TPA: transglutaminase domain-containing protein, partial [Bacteroidia bacterium]|nr:transglutaminase domain-containing protein [Bacteroidia bacterium]
MHPVCQYLLSVFIFFILPFNSLPAQETPDPLTLDYQKADSIALHFPKKNYKDYTQLAGPLTEGLHTDPEKFRVLFRWITDNIQYSFGQKSDDPDKAVKNKKAVCIGYSSLLRDMCKSVGINCEVISGYSKTQVKDIGQKLRKTDHAWNAVQLSGKWYLVDVTWATGYYDFKKNKAVKKYD